MNEKEERENFLSSHFLWEKNVKPIHFSLGVSAPDVLNVFSTSFDQETSLEKYKPLRRLRFERERERERESTNVEPSGGQKNSNEEFYECT